MKRVCATVLLLVLCLGVVLCRVATPAAELRKQLAGPPSEFTSMAIPSTEDASLRADSTFLPFTLRSSRGSFTWTSDYPVDTPEQITVTVLSPHKDQLQFWLRAPNDEVYHKVDQSLFDGPLSMGKSYYSSSFGIDGAAVPAYSYVFYNPPTGYWGIIINSTSNLPAGPHGYLLLDNLSNYKILSKLNSYVLEAGQQAGVTVQLIEEHPNELSAADSLPTYTTVKDVITVAKLNVKLPSGQETSVPLHDDGLLNDLSANDGIYTASIPTTTSGNYVFQPILEGVLNHQPFARSVSHLVGVSSSSLRLSNSAQYRYSKDKSIIYFDISTTGASSEPVLAYAQVWGQSSQKPSESVPIAWVESIVDVNSNTITLQLNHNWVVLAKAVPPFTLQQLSLQDKEINTILSTASVIHVKNPQDESQLLTASHLYKTIAPTVTSEITEAMKYGPRPVEYSVSPNASVSATAASGLVLVHGYCSGEVWDLKQFTNAFLFTDYKQSRSQDQFALLIKKFAEETSKLTSYGIVAHSQGGLASVHLKAYYWSGLDNAQGNRLIQSVGSPYRGCSLAGNLADLGGLFGIGCSSNNDLAPNGAQVWLSKVPKEAQDKVYYYTTQYDDSWFLSPACVTASGMVLYSPNDGTCEIKYSTLDKSGNNMGTTKKFCHTDGMNYPPQTKDAARNTIMNKEAAR